MKELRARMEKVASEATDGVALVPPELIAAVAARRKTRRRVIAAVTVSVVLGVGVAFTVLGRDRARVTVTTPPAGTAQGTRSGRGAVLYESAGCAACHGQRGEGGIGPKVAGGQAASTFPAVADEVEWIKSGSGPFEGRRYGNSSRPGGQAGPARGIMPSFASVLSDADIAAIVAYERTLP